MKAAEWAIIAESGHSAYWERPECFNAAVLAFLRKH
jgi:pimeloyl-ACP methyl ester carboxylesterase